MGNRGFGILNWGSKVTFEDSKDYFLNVANIHGNIMLHREIYNDFCNNLDPEKTHNLFVGWCLQNYRDCLLLNLCKMLEPKNNDNKYTLRYFVEFCIKNHDVIKERMATTKRVWPSGIIEDFSEIMLKKLDEINFTADRDRIDHMLSKLKKYRDKRLCHSDVDGIDVLPPEIKEMHQFVDELEVMIKKYYSLFREDVSNYGITNLRYNDFTLHMP